MSQRNGSQLSPLFVSVFLSAKIMIMTDLLHKPTAIFRSTEALYLRCLLSFVPNNQKMFWI